MLPILSLLVACQPCQQMYSGDHFAKSSMVIAILKNGKPPPEKPGPKPPDRVGSRGAFEADVIEVLKGSLKAKRITVRWDYGMCSYPAPNVTQGAAVVFLSGSDSGGWSPGANGCGPVQLAYDEKTKTIDVDGDALTVAEFKKRYGKGP